MLTKLLFLQHQLQVMAVSSITLKRSSSLSVINRAQVPTLIITITHLIISLINIFLTENK